MALNTQRRILLSMLLLFTIFIGSFIITLNQTTLDIAKPSGAATGTIGLTICPPCEAETITETITGGGRTTSYIQRVSSLFVTAPSNILQGEDISLLVQFKRKAYTNKVNFLVQTPNGIEIEEKEFEDLKSDEDLKFTLKGTTSKSLKPGTYELKFISQIDEKTIFSSNFNLTLRGVLDIVDICGNYICEENYGENEQNCQTDCKGIARFLIPWLTPQTTILVAIAVAIASILTIIFFYTSDLGSEMLLRKYIRNSLAKSIHPDKILIKLTHVGWPRKQVMREIERVKHPLTPRKIYIKLMEKYNKSFK